MWTNPSSSYLQIFTSTATCCWSSWFVAKSSPPNLNFDWFYKEVTAVVKSKRNNLSFLEKWGSLFPDKKTKAQKHKNTKTQKHKNTKKSFSLLEKWGSLSPLPNLLLPWDKDLHLATITQALHCISLHPPLHTLHLLYTVIAFHYTHHYIAHIAHITCVTSVINRHFFTPTITAHTLHTLHLLYTGITLHLITPTLQHTRYNRTKS